MLARNPVKPYPFFDSVFASLSDWLRKRRQIRETRRRLDQCDGYEVARIAQEVGLTPSELRRMMKLGPDAANLLLVRMAALHLDADVLARTRPGVMRDLQRLCATCISKKQCRRDIQSDSDDAVWRQYCPNKSTLTALESSTAFVTRPE